MKRFDNRTVIVTGGARGMGASFARGFVADVANVVIADVLEQEGRTLADELADHAIFSRLDVTSEESVRLAQHGLRWERLASELNWRMYEPNEKNSCCTDAQNYASYLR